MSIATLPTPARVIGFYTTAGRLVCRDPYCVDLIRLRNDSVERIVKRVGWERTTCDFCGGKLC